ncbi:MAG: peptidase dimerization domain-containing protein, partial [Vicinamibacteria bacterium]
GMWGGPVPDPASALAKMLASLHDDDGRIAIKGIYDRVRPMTAREKADLDRLGVTEKIFREQTGMVSGARVLGGTKNPYEAIWRQPSLTINAIQASTREQARNIICDTAWARVGIRIVPDQKPEEVRDLLVDHLRRSVPWGLAPTIRPLTAESWWMTDPTGPVFEKARKAFSAGYGKETVFIGCGGSIPFVAPFSEALGGAPALLIGVEDPYTNAHGENESLSLVDFDGAVRSSIHLYAQLGG